MATKVSVRNLVPSMVLMAVSGWCTWSALDDPDAGAAARYESSPEITQVGRGAGDRPGSRGATRSRAPVGRTRGGRCSPRGPAADPGDKFAVATVENPRIAAVLKAMGDVFTVRGTAGAKPGRRPRKWTWPSCSQAST